MRQSSSVKVDYDALMQELIRVKKEKELYHLTMYDFCKKWGVTVQRVYMMKRNPQMGVNTIKKMIKMGLNIDAFIVKD